MKKILSMAALALVMAGCSNDDENVKIDNGEASNAVAIQISQKVAGVESKAAITPGADMLATIIMVDESSSTSSPDFAQFTPKTENELMADGTGGKKLGSDDKRATVATTTFKASTTAAAIGELTPKLYYPVEEKSSEKKTFLFGVSPIGDVSGTSVTFNEKDGSQDVMFTGAVDAGSKKSHETKPELVFEHQTTQLTFVAKLSGDLTGSDWVGKEVTVKNIVIQSAQVPASLNINGGTIDWTKGANLTVKGCDTKLTTEACQPSIPVMVKPATSILVNLELSVSGTSKWYNNLTIKNEDNEALTTNKAQSHEITFTITPPITALDGTQIEANAKIVDWEKGAAGNVTIQ